MITVVCYRCGRRDVHKVEPLLMHGDVRLTDLRIGLTMDCPRRAATSIYEQYGARFEIPPF